MTSLPIRDLPHTASPAYRAGFAAGEAYALWAVHGARGGQR